MPRIGVACSVFLCLAAQALLADISGRVVDRAGAPVAEATVVLRRSGTTAVSGVDGIFVLPASEASYRGDRRRTDVPVCLRRDAVAVTVSAPHSTVDVAVFALDGRVIARPAHGRYAAGVHRIALPVASDAMRIVRVTIDGARRALRVSPGQSGRSSGGTAGAAEVSAAAMDATGLSPADTVAVRKPGYAGAVRAVTGLDADVGDIVLPDVDPGMVLIPARDSTFLMGQPSSTIDGYTAGDEQPEHAVMFSYDFYMDTVEVTQADYKAVGGWAEGPFELASSTFQRAGISDDRPAHSMNWYTAVLYCNARSIRDGLDTVYEYSDSTQISGDVNCYELSDLVVHLERNGYRLPTEAEWEYAYGAGENVDLYWAGAWVDDYPATAADSAQIDSFAVYRGNSYECGTGDPSYGTHPVASRIPNVFGLYDMSGNVREWCNDWYNNGAYASAGDTVIDPNGPQGGSDKVVRGGGWESHARFVRGTDRNYFNEGSYARDIGFRVVLPVR